MKKKHGNKTKKASQRINQALRKKAKIVTPKGSVTSRPQSCQLCGFTPKKSACWGGGEMTNIIAHHYAGYGTKKKDLTVIFICRLCHGKIHYSSEVAK